MPIYRPRHSSLIHSVEYDPAEKRMSIVFAKNGERYNYPDVPRPVFDRFVASDSPGKYFLSDVKPFYKGTKEEKTEEGK